MTLLKTIIRPYFQTLNNAKSDCATHNPSSSPDLGESPSPLHGQLERQRPRPRSGHTDWLLKRDWEVTDIL